MDTVSLGDTLQEKSNPISWYKKQIVIYLSSVEFASRVLKLINAYGNREC